CEALAELFGLAAPAAPAVFIDAAESADSASIDALRYLAAATTAPAGALGSGLVVVALRDGEPQPPSLADLVARTPSLSLPLSGLDLEGIRAFLSRPEVAERLLAMTGGRPQELEHAVAQTGDAVDFTARRIAALAAGEGRALRALAVLGAPSRAREVSAVCGS